MEKTTTQRRVIQRKYPAARGKHLSGRKIVSDEGKRKSSSGRSNYPSGRSKKPPKRRGDRYRGGGSSVGIGITIDLGRLLEQAQTPPPRQVYPKPKRKKKTTTARRRSPRKRVSPPVLLTIPQFIPNEILVLVTSDQPDAVGVELAAALGLTIMETVPVALLEGSIIRFRYPDNRPLVDVIATLTLDPRVSQAQPNNWYHPVGQKRVHSKKSNPQYSLGKLSIGPAHEISQGRDVRVAVIDTGIDARHPSLTKAIAMSFDAVGDGKKTVDKHGTAIAGLIAGQGRVNIGD